MKPKAQVLTTDGQMIEIHDETNAAALFFDCMATRRTIHFLKIETKDSIRFIPIHRIQEVIILEEPVECQDQD